MCLDDSGPKPTQLTAKQLTTRERDVLVALCDGPTDTASIARRLHLEPTTVKGHLKRLMDKLHVKSRAQLVAWAFRNNVVT